MNATNLHTLARVALVATFLFSQTLFFAVGTGVLVTAAAIVAFATLLILALRLPEGRRLTLFMAVMTLPLIGSALTGFVAAPESSGLSSNNEVCMETVNGVWSTVSCPLDFSVDISALGALLTLQFALPLFLLGFAGYVWSSARGSSGVRLFAVLGLLASAGVATLGAEGFGGFIIFLIASPILVITGLLLVVWAFSPRGKRSSAPATKSAPARRSAATDPKRGRVFVAAAALAASLSLAYSFAAGLAFQGFPSDSAETAMPSFGSLTTSLRTGEGFLLGDYYEKQLHIASGYSIEKLLLIEANEPCVSSGSCSILGVIGVHQNDSSIPVPFLIPADQEDRVVEQLNAAAADYFAMEQDPQMGYGVRERIKSLTAEGNYPPVFPTPVRVEGGEAETLVRQAHRLLASTSYQQNFEFLLFLPFLFVALIPFGALRWAWAAYAGRSSLELLPGTTISTQSYGVTSGVALLLGGAIVGLIAGSMNEAAWTGLAVSSLIAGVTTLVATLYRRRS